MARRCFYCGAEAAVDDPGIPAWAVEQVGLTGSEVEHLVASGNPIDRPADGPVDALPYGIPSHAELGTTQPVDRLHERIDTAIEERARLAVSEYAARSLCRACAKAIGKLDARALPLLTEMIRGRRVELDADQQRTLAAWGARQACAVLAVERKAQGVPKAHRRAIRERAQPHDDVFVGLGRYRKDHIGVLAARLLVPLGEAGEDVEAYSVLVVLGRMTLKVFGIHRRPETTRVKPPEGEIVRLWPPHAESVDWPPLWALDESTLDSAFLYEPFYRPFVYAEVRYLGAGQKQKAKRRRVEGPGPRR